MGPVLGALGAIGAGIASNAGNIWNAFTTLKSWQRDDYFRQKTWDREDNAVQRRVADLKAAGLSPVLAAGSAASASAPISSTRAQSIENPVATYLGTVQQKKDISQTEAQTALTEMQKNTEAFKKLLMNSQVNEIDQRIKNMQSEKNGIDLRNSWINADMSSQIKLRDANTQKAFKETGRIAADTVRLGQQTELLKAETAYRQTALQQLLTDIDIAKIVRDQKNFDLTASGLRLYNETYQANKGILGRVFGDVRNLFTGPDISHAIKNMDTSWYWDKK